MATTSNCVGILKVAIHLQEGDTKTIKVWRFDGDQLPGYTHERVEQEILELFPHIEKKGLRLRMHYYDDLAGKVYIDSNADIHWKASLKRGRARIQGKTFLCYM